MNRRESSSAGACTRCPTVSPDVSDMEVFEHFASYDMLTLGVTDEGGHLLGAVSVDDVVDRMLGAGWRQRHRGVATATGAVS